MKKTSQATPDKSTKSPRSSRHSKSTAKPVTIDLKAQTVKAEPSPSTSKPTQTTAAKTSVPKTAKTSAGIDTGAPKPANDKTTSTKNETSDFDRNGNPKIDKPTIPTAKPTKSSNWPSKFIPALVGGCVALIGAGLLQYVGILSSPGSSVEALTSQQVQFSEKLAALENKTGTSLDAAKVDAQIDKKIAGISQTSTTADIEAVANQVNETTVRVEKLQTQFVMLNEMVSSGGAGEEAALSTITARLTELQAITDQLTNDLSTAKSTLTSEGTTGNAGLVASVATLQSELPSLKQIISNQLTTMAQRLDGIEKNANQLPSLKSAIAALQEKATGKDAASQLAARAIAAAALKSDIDQGLPFADSLRTLKSLAGDSNKLDGLSAFATSGVPTSAQLVTQFDNTGDAILKALAPKPKDDLTSRLLAGAKSFVKVKTTAPIEGTSPTAIVSQISDALLRGNLPAASSLWSTLPNEGKSISSSWHDRLHSRISANEIISRNVQSYLLSGANK